MVRRILGICVSGGVLLVSAFMAGCGGGTGAPANPPAASAGASGGAATVQAIQAKLAADKSLAGVKVTDQGGAIALEGTVPSVAAKDKAEAIATAAQQEQKQPVGVLNNLMVK